MKKSTQNTSLTPIETALQTQFKPTAENCQQLIKSSFESTMKTQSANLVAIFGFGFLALSIKPIVGHGNFGEWLSKTLDGELSKTTAYRWIGACKYLIQKIETAGRQTDVVSGRIYEFLQLYKITVLMSSNEQRYLYLWSDVGVAKLQLRRV